MTRGILNAILVCILSSLTLGLPVRAATAASGFSRGNTLYAAADFAGAVEAYEGQVHQGEYTANLFFNLGNAYYRRGNRGRAILNYQRALILDPAHAEATANLAFARGGKPASPNRAGWIATILPWLTATAGWLAVAGLVLVLSGRRWRAVGYGLMALGLMACAGGVAGIRFADDGVANTARAVIVADSAPAFYAPADNSKVVTNLTAGAEVRVLSDQGAWVYTLLGDGTRAWLAAAKLEPIVPR